MPIYGDLGDKQIFCTVDSGIPLFFTTILKWCLDALWEAVSLTDSLLEMAEEHDVWIPTPWGTVLYIKKDGNPFDFRMNSSERYWAVNVFGFVIPLPKALGCIRQMLDVSIPGSELYHYVDYDLSIRQGIDCTPPQDTTFSEMAISSMKWTIIYKIAKALRVIGLMRVSANLISTWWYQAKTLNSISDIVKENFEALLKDFPTDDAVMDKLNSLSSLIGVRLILR